jgi:hypothetical protein
MDHTILTVVHWSHIQCSLGLIQATSPPQYLDSSPNHRSSWSCSIPLHTSAIQSLLLCLHTSHAKYGQCIHPTFIQIPFKVHYNMDDDVQASIEDVLRIRPWDSLIGLPKALRATIHWRIAPPIALYLNLEVKTLHKSPQGLQKRTNVAWLFNTTIQKGIPTTSSLDLPNWLYFIKIMEVIFSHGRGDSQGLWRVACGICGSKHSPFIYNYHYKWPIRSWL